MRRYLIILAILIIILIGAYYFIERSLSDKSPPSIVNLSWVPVREINDKIYDINVTFVARDDRSPIAYAELHFIPVEYYYMIEKYGMRPEDYPKARGARATFTHPTSISSSLPIIKVLLEAFNEWFEGTQVEPSEGYGFTYLEILKDVLRGG